MFDISDDVGPRIFQPSIKGGYHEFITILEGRLILTPDSGGEFEYKAGDSLIVPKGYVGGWDMPERYRELIVVDTEFMQEAAEVADS